MDKRLPYKYFRGFRIPYGGNETYFAQASVYAASKEDIFIVSYPKCGTTWVQNIVHLLLKDGCPANSMADVFSCIPFPEQDGFPEDMSHVIALKYHLPFKLMPYHPDASYIYIARNPKDACVSYYHFLKKLPGYKIESFSDFFEAFLNGQLAYGDFTEHVLGWYEAQYLTNVLFVTYESLTYNKRQVIQNIASFLKIENLQERVIEDVMKYSTFEFMKNLAERDIFMQQYLRQSTHLENELSETEAPKMMRNGRVGDWKKIFTPNQSHQMNLSLQVKSRDTDLLSLWNDHII